MEIKAVKRRSILLVQPAMYTYRYRDKRGFRGGRGRVIALAESHDLHSG